VFFGSNLMKNGCYVVYACKYLMGFLLGFVSSLFLVSLCADFLDSWGSVVCKHPLFFLVLMKDGCPLCYCGEIRSGFLEKLQLSIWFVAVCSWSAHKSCKWVSCS